MPKPKAKVRRHDVRTWPRTVRHAMDTIAGLIAIAFQAGRERISKFGKDARFQAELDAKDQIIRQQAIELDLWRRRFKAIPPRERPHFAPEDRFTILRLAWLYGWSAKDIAERFVLSTPTARRWFRLWRGEKDPGTFFGKPPWNKMSDAVRALVHDGFAKFPELGTRAITAQICKAGVVLSRSFTQRVRREKPPTNPAASAKSKPGGADGVKPYHILKPEKINRTWHLDLSTIRVLWLRFHIVAILDGFSRKLLALSAAVDTPTSASVLKVVRMTVRKHGKPRFLVFDHGGQFQDHFVSAVGRTTIPVQSRPRHPEFNGKIERFFKTMKLWQRVAMLFARLDGVQKRLDIFRDWYNTERCHQGLLGLTPDETWYGAKRPAPRRFLARDRRQPLIRLRRLNHCSDPHLPVFDIQVMQAARKPA